MNTGTMQTPAGTGTAKAGAIAGERPTNGIETSRTVLDQVARRQVVVSDKLIRLAIALVWLYQGLWCKVLGGAPLYNLLWTPHWVWKSDAFGSDNQGLSNVQSFVSNGGNLVAECASTATRSPSAVMASIANSSPCGNTSKTCAAAARICARVKRPEISVRPIVSRQPSSA